MNSGKPDAVEAILSLQAKIKSHLCMYCESTRQFKSKGCLRTLCVLHRRVIHKESCLLLSSTRGLYDTDQCTLSNDFQTSLVHCSMSLLQIPTSRQSQSVKKMQTILYFRVVTKLSLCQKLAQTHRIVATNPSLVVTEKILNNMLSSNEYKTDN